MPRESAEEKIARIVRETMGAERQRAEDESNPQLGTLRRVIREEVGSVFGDLLKSSGKGGGRPGGEADEGEGDNVFDLRKLLGG